MNTREPESVRHIRELVSKFLDREAPRDVARRWEEAGEVPLEVYRKLVDLGVMGISVPEEYGGLGRNIPGTMAVIQELSRRSFMLNFMYVMCACYVGLTMTEIGSEEQRRYFLPKVVTGDVWFCYAWTEPDGGPDLPSVTTTAVRDGDEVVINGTKRFIGGASMCDYLYTLVRSGPAEDRYNNLSIFLIPRATRGVELRNLKTMLGSHTYEVTLENVRVPMTNLVGGPEGWNRAWKMFTGPGLDIERLLAASGALGIAEAAFAEAWEYSQQRRQFGRPICAFQSIRHKLADMSSQLYACRLMLQDTAELVNERQKADVQTSQAKLFVSESAKQIALDSQTIMGAYGYSKDYDTERLVREALLSPIVGGSSAAQRNNIVNLMGLPKR